MRRLLSPVTQALLLLYQAATATWLGFFVFSELFAAASNATAGSDSSGLSVLPGAQCWAFSGGREGRALRCWAAWEPSLALHRSRPAPLFPDFPDFQRLTLHNM